MKLISYEIFRQRKKFNPITLFKQNKNITYEQFKEFFESRLVESPDLNYYMRVKNKFFEDNITFIKEENKTDEIQEGDDQKKDKDHELDNKKDVKKQITKKVRKAKENSE